MKIFLIILGSILFFISTAAHIYVRFKFRPKQDSNFDEIYWEFEDTHPGFAKYKRLSQATFTGIVIGTLMLFLSLVF